MESQFVNSSIFDQKDCFPFTNSWDRDLFRKSSPSSFESSFDNAFWKFDDSKFKHLDNNLFKLADLFRTQNEASFANNGQPSRSHNYFDNQDLLSGTQFKSQMHHFTPQDHSKAASSSGISSVGSISPNMSDLDSPKYDFKFKEFPVSSVVDESLMEPNPNRTIVGRGVNYYKRFGNQCIYIPANPTLPPGIQQRALSSKPVSFKPANNSVNCTPPSSIMENATKAGHKSFKRRPKTFSKMECVFCKNNRTNSELYRTHWLKDNKSRVICPVLRAYSCPICNNGGGDFAHTFRYCPQRMTMNQRNLRIPNNADGNNNDDNNSI